MQEPNPRDTLAIAMFGREDGVTTKLADLIRDGWPQDELVAEYQRQLKAYVNYCDNRERRRYRDNIPRVLWAPEPTADTVKKVLRGRVTTEPPTHDGGYREPA